MAHKRILSLLSACSIAAVGLAGLAAPAFAGPFELDGDVAVGTATGEDWSGVIFNGTGTFKAKTFTADAAPKSIFTGGGSKDDLDLNGPLAGAGGWKYKQGSVPDKDDITNAYSAAYSVPRGDGTSDLVIYAGADRFDNSGDAFIGFWFFQNKIGLSGGELGAGAFTGLHRKGDVLVLANFTGGGTNVNIEVLEWVGSGGNVNGTLQRIGGIAGGTPAKCSGGVLGANQLFCGITNETGGETPPWSYTAKSGSHSYPVATFFEMGINITQVFKEAAAGAVPCFASFLAETRASSSVSATLKDFVLGPDFNVCSIGVSKQCGAGEALAGGFSWPIAGQVSNTGAGTLTATSLVDNPATDGPFQYFTCDAAGLPTTTVSSLGSLNPGQSVCYKATVSSVNNGASDTITASASAGLGSSVSANAGATCLPVPQPKLAVDKGCAVVLEQRNSALEVRVNVSGQVCNTGDTGLSGISVFDNPAITLLTVPSASLAAGTCSPYSGFYYPSIAENRLAVGSSTTIPGLALFTDTITATGSFGAVQKSATATASCSLCPTCSTDVCTKDGCTSGAAVNRSSTLLKK
jgi:hypothetical protein